LGDYSRDRFAMTEVYEPDFVTLERYLKWVMEQGAVALAINADTGEGPHLSRSERRPGLGSCVSAAAGRCGIIAGIGGPYTDGSGRKPPVMRKRQARMRCWFFDFSISGTGS